MAWPKIMLIALLSVNLHYGVNGGEVLPHLENMFTAVLLKDPNAFKMEFDAIRNNFFEEMKEHACNKTMTSHEKIRRIFGINNSKLHNIGSERFERPITYICGVIEGIKNYNRKSNDMDLMRLKTRGAEILEENVDKILHYIIDLFIDSDQKIPDANNLQAVLTKFKIMDQDFSINNCDGDYSFYRHLYIQFLNGFKEKMNTILRTQICVGFKIWFNDQIPNPKINPNVQSPDEFMLEYTKLITSMALTTKIEHRLCDTTESPERDIDFIELERLHQLVYIPQPLTNEGGCEKLRGYNISGPSENQDSKAIGCKGFVQNCHAHSKIQMCYEKNEPKGTRIFKWIKTNISTGNTTSASSSDSTENTTSASSSDSTESTSSASFSACDSESFLEVSSEPKTLDQCLCECTSNYGNSEDSTFIFSREPIRSDYSKNKVITGIKFAKKDKIIYLEATEGELVPQGKIKNDSNQPLLARTISRLDLLKEVKKLHPENKSVKLYHNDWAKSYVNLNEANNRLALTEGRCPPGHVVIGVKLDHIYLYWEKKSTLGIFVRCCKMNAKQGILGKCGSDIQESWLNQGIQHMHGGWKHVNITGKLTPLNIGNLAMSQNVTDNIAPLSVIQFQMSDREKDSGQTTVPLLDARMVSINGKFPLNSIGLYHRGNDQSSGFVGFRVSTGEQTLRAN